MSTCRTIIAASGFIFLLSLGVIFWAINERTQASKERSEWAQKDNEMRSLLKRVQTAASASVKTASDLEAANTRPAPAATSRNKPPPSWMTILAGQPELQLEFEKAYRAKREHLYGKLYLQLHLSQTQIDQLDNLAAKYEESSADLAAAAQEQNLDANDSAIAQQRKSLTKEFHQQEEALLGRQSYAILQQFDNEEPVRTAVSQAASMVLFSGTPFTGDQEEQLTQLLAQSSNAFQLNPNKPIALAAVDWDTVLARAQGFLSPAQIGTLNAKSQQQALWTLESRFFSQQGAGTK